MKVMKKRYREYLQSMLQVTLDNVFLPEMKDFLPNVVDIPKNIATKDKPDMEEAISNMRNMSHTNHFLCSTMC